LRNSSSREVGTRGVREREDQGMLKLAAMIVLKA
jgi:hypothetical protein